MTKDQVRSTEEAISTERALDLALEALENNRRTHYYCEDTWYSCPKHEDGCANEAEGDECNCGADKANQEIDKAITAIKQARSAPYVASPRVQEPVAWTNWRELAGARHYRTPGWEMYADKRNPDDVALYTTPPGGRQSEDRLTAAQEDIQRLSALVRAQQITIDKLEQARSASVQVSPLEFVTMVMEKEHLVGEPLFWAEWPNKENT